MHLKSLTLNGFKSFPDRTRLDFGPGVSVVVGPNGSGKSNVTDAVLWAMGEQSPLAVRGQSMQDVIFAGGRGTQARSAAEVEIVLDNSDGTVGLPLSEISIVRRLERNGDGGYRLNGARCRLTDVIEVLSDTGLGRETHSVISQGRVEGIVTSRPRDRRLLLEEAAGLGKHRKRRRRAQLKLERTQENLDRALDIEREARSRLRPLKRQAEAAELHERLERQLLEARWLLVGDTLRARRAELAAAETAVRRARERRASVEARLDEVIARRGRAERSLTERSERHDAIASRLYAARSARDRVALRGEQTLTSAQLLARRIERAQGQLGTLAHAGEGEHVDDAPAPPRGEPATDARRSASPAPREALEEAWETLSRAIADGVQRAQRHTEPRSRDRAIAQVVADVRRLAERVVALAVEQAREQDESPPAEGSQVAASPDGERRTRHEHATRTQRLNRRLELDRALSASAERLGQVLAHIATAIEEAVVCELEQALQRDSAEGEQAASELRACAQEEAELQTELRGAGELVTEAEVGAQRLRDQVDEAQAALDQIASRLGRDTIDGVPAEALGGEEELALTARVQRLERRREQLGPVNPLAQDEYAQAREHVGELEVRRGDLETALRELRTVIRDTDRQIRETFEATFTAAADNFEQLAGDLFPGGSGRLRLVSEDRAPSPVLGGQPLPDGAPGAQEPERAGGGRAGGGEANGEDDGEDDDIPPGEQELKGVEIEITPAGKATKRLSLLSGGEKSMTALAFLFAVFLARPCPFYILDEVEAALDDLNLDRFLALLRRYSDRAQFIVITHQKRTMEAADWLYGVSMAQDGVSKVVSRRLPPPQERDGHAPRAADVALADVAEVA
ncbi:MAG TPA: AAA family ATPase [Solirubrobacteraceae bacterium]|nr:AAA family ATPase [Solirubrobacteraceae bacterium]